MSSCGFSSCSIIRFGMPGFDNDCYQVGMYYADPASRQQDFRLKPLNNVWSVQRAGVNLHHCDHRGIWRPTLPEWDLEHPRVVERHSESGMKSDEANRPRPPISQSSPLAGTLKSARLNPVISVTGEIVLHFVGRTHSRSLRGPIAQPLSIAAAGCRSLPGGVKETNPFGQLSQGAVAFFC